MGFVESHSTVASNGPNTKALNCHNVRCATWQFTRANHALVIATHGRGILDVDDITPLRALTADTLAKAAVFLQAKPSVQAIPAGGGWANGDAAFVGPINR